MKEKLQSYLAHEGFSDEEAALFSLVFRRERMLKMVIAVLSVMVFSLLIAIFAMRR